MEVHHHPEVEKKGFKEYILEGLMIFLAVTMGFFAESIRENITNKEHVKQLTSQLLLDLKTDTANLNILYEDESQQMAKQDTLIQLLNEPIANMDKKKMQFLVLYCYDIREFHPTTGAMGAIKSELHLRQFSNSKLISLMADYEQATNTMQKSQDLQYQNIREYLQTFFSQHFTSANLDADAFQHRGPVDGQLLNVTQADLARLASQVEVLKITNYYMRIFNRALEEKAVKLTGFINKEYHLEE
ncbi:MAG: hypothetical protein ACHQHN_16855 [Sphingobacteriales bacterium]